MSKQHRLYHQILEELVGLDQRKDMPSVRQRRARACAYLDLDKEEPKNPIQSLNEATGGFENSSRLGDDDP